MMMVSLQKNLLGIAEELDQIRPGSLPQKDAYLLATNIGRLQGIANGLDWHFAHVDGISRITHSVGFDLSNSKTMSPEEEEFPLEEEEDPEDQDSFQKRR